MTTQVTDEDGTELNLVEHLSHVHQKGTKGFTEEYLANLHKTLHQSRREPQPEHAHPDVPAQPGEFAESVERPAVA